MDRRRWRFVIVLGIAAIAASIAYLVRLSPTPPIRDASEATADDAAWAEWDLEPPETARPSATSRGPTAPISEEDEGPVPAPTERGEWRARREQWWSQQSEENRAQWRERRRGRVEIVPLGPRPTRLDEDGVHIALREQLPAMRECFREAGGFGALREARRESGATGRPTVRFDVGPEGSIAEGTLSIEPPMPEAFDACVRTAFTAARFGDVGGEGAGVELEMGRGRRGRGDASLDGGVPRSRERRSR